jgi:CHAP domain
MSTAEQTLDHARSYLGQGPQDFWAWYPAPAGTAWCCIFQSKVLTEMGIGTHYAWVTGLFDQYRSQGRTFAPHEAQPGDLIAFDYDGNGPSSYDHIAMVESVNNDGIVAINGNWENRVQRVLHRWTGSGYAAGIAEIARPAYDSAPAPFPQPSQEDCMNVWLMRANNSPEVFVVQANLAGRWHLPSPDLVNSIAYVLLCGGGKVLTPPADTKPETLGSCQVWVVQPSFLRAIPIVKQ